MSTCLAYDTGVQDAKWIPKWHADNTIFKPSDAGVATMSDEGNASGVHLHMQVNVGTFLDVQWNDSVGAYVNDSLHLVLDRSAQKDKGVHAQYWLAHEGDDVSKMVRVVWKAIQYAGESKPSARWVKFDDNSAEWDPIQKKFISHA